MFLALYIAARYVSQKDPQLIRIMLRSAGARALYDPGKLDAILVERGEQQ
jgi:hypothetical protein